MYAKTHTAGYSFVEVLVAIAILLVSIVGPLTIASTGLKNALFARDQNTAFFLAQEGIESIVYLRDQYGLAHIANENVDPWGWFVALPSGCQAGDPCRVDIAAETITECDPVDECDLYLHDTGSVRYRHDADGAETPFRRLLYISSVDSNTVLVRSVVEWHATAFGATQTVELETHLSNIYAN